MKALISCYACSPYKGSEPGMGWNFVMQISSFCEVHVLVEGKFRKDIEHYFEEHPEKHRGKYFYFIDKQRHRRLRKIWPPSYYWFYRDWQKKAYEKAMELDAVQHFDLVHQLNMVGYREPGYLWKMGKPMVWGPIGGFNITPWCMLSSMGAKGALFYFSRNIINLWQMHTSLRVKQAMANADALIAATQNEADTIRRLYGRESTIIPEVGFSGETSPFVPHERAETLKLCWCGQFTSGKSLNLLIDSLKQIKQNIELHVLGDGECASKWKKQAESLDGVNIHWYGWLDRAKVMQIMKSCDVFCITSLSDLTSTVLLEALSCGLPVIALDHCGFSNVITDECGIKIPILDKKQVVADFAKAIDIIAADDTLRQKMSHAAYNRSLLYNWEAKGDEVRKIYKSILK